MNLQPRTGRVPTAIWLVVALLLAAVAIGTLTQLSTERRALNARAAADVERAIQVNEASLNRSLLIVDLLLAAQGRRLADVVDGPRFDRAAQSRILREAVEQQLQLRDLVLVNADGRVDAAALAATERMGVSLPREFLDRVLAPVVPSVHMSPAILNRATGERSLWMARPLPSPPGPDGAPGPVRHALLAEVPLAALAGTLSVGRERDGIVLTVEGADGRLLLSLPHRESRQGELLAGPLDASRADGRSHEGMTRLDDRPQPALIALRPAVYPSLLLSVAVPKALLDERAAAETDWLPASAWAAAGVMVVIAALLHWHLWQQARARAEMEGARVRLAESHEALVQQALARERADAGLLRTQRLMEGLLARTHEGFWQIDLQGRTVDVNPAMCALLGRTREQMLASTIFDYVDEANAAEFRRQLSIRNSGAGSSYEITLTRGDGSALPCINNATPILDERGERVGSVGLWTDVSLLVRTQRELAHAKRTLDRALDSMDEGFVLYDLQDHLRVWNRRYEQMLGHEPGELQEGLSRRAVLAQVVRRVLSEASEDERRAWVDHEWCRPIDGPASVQVMADGRIIEITRRSTPDGGFVAVTRDVTDERRAQRELSQAKTTLDQALDAMSDGFIVLDAEERLLTWNHRYAQMFPFSAPLLQVGRPIEDLVRAYALSLMPDVAEDVRARYVAERLASRRANVGVARLASAGGRVFEATDRRTTEGHWVSLYRDVTQAAEASRALAQARDAAESAARAKTQFLAAMSHEIRTPLNAVLGMNGLLLDTRLDAEQRRYAELIGKSGESLLAVINDILDLSRLEAGKLTLELVDFSLVRAVHDVVSMMTARAQAKGLALEMDVVPADEAFAVRGDPSRLRQVLFNLMGNAIKFTESGSVRVRIERVPRRDARIGVALSVADSGIGIAPDVLPHLFEPFAQADSSTSRRFGGSGLGLSICKQIVELMGGRIAVDSTPGRGSRFTVTLVLDAALQPPEASRFVHAVAPARAVRARRVLVAEDNSVNQIMIGALLKHLGHYADIVADGVEAVRAVQAAPYDVVLMDVQMPQMDGLAATRAIRALGGDVARIPILAMTANVMAEDRSACSAAGMNGFVPKPIDRQALQDALQAV